MTEMMFEYLEDPEIVITRGGAEATAEQLTVASVALGKIAHAYDYGQHGEIAQAHKRWMVLSYGVIAASDDPSEYYRRQGEDPGRAQLLGGRIALAMRHSRWGVPEDELGHAMTIASTQGVPRTEFLTLATLATLVIEAAEALRGEVNAEKFPVQCLTEETGERTGEGEPQRWAGVLAARLDRPELLEVETKHVLIATLGALIDGHEWIRDWIPRDQDPSVRIRDPHDYPGLPLIVTPFVMETKAAWEAVEEGAIVDRAFIEAAPTVQALRAELAQGPTKAS